MTALISWVQYLLRLSVVVTALAPMSHAFSDTDAHCDVLMCAADGTTYTLKWMVDETTQTLNATMQAPSNGENTWVAVGFSQGNSDPMQGGTDAGHFADIVIGSYSSSLAESFVVRDYHTSSKTTPTLDESQDVFINLEQSSYDADTNTLTIGFWRPLNTGDTDNDKILVVDDSLTLLWGYNPYADSMSNSDGGQTLTKHDTTARGYSTGYSFTVGAAAATVCEACEASSISQYDERIAQCVSNGWPSVEETTAFSGDTLTFDFTVTCSVCSRNKLTDQSINFVADTLKSGLEQALSDAEVDTTITLGLTNTTDVLDGSTTPTVSLSATLTSTLEGSSDTIKPILETAFNDNDGAIVIDLLNSMQSATTITNTALATPITMTTASTSSTTTCLSNEDGTWFASWEVDTTSSGQDVINVTIQSTAASADGWVGIGFHKSDNFPVEDMGPGDFYIGSINDGVGDYHLSSSTNGQPDVDDQNDVLADGSGCSYDESSGILSCVFQRLLSTGDSDDVELSSGSEVGILYASSDSSFPAFHTIYGSASAMIDMTIPCEEVTALAPVKTLAIVHGVLMVIAWILLLPWGAFVARFRDSIGMNPQAPHDSSNYTIDSDLKRATDFTSKVSSSTGSSGPALWFRIHEPVQWVGVGVMIVSLVIIIIDAGLFTAAIRSASPTNGNHQIIGIIVAILAISQPIFAFWRNGCSKEASESQKNAAHKRWHILHAVVGVSSLILAFVAMPLGVAELSGTGNVDGFFIAGEVVLLLGLCVISIIVSTLRCKNRNKFAVSTGEASSQENIIQGSINAEDPNTIKGHTLWAYILLIIQLLACAFCIAGIVTTGLFQSSSSGSAAVSDAVQGDYDFCNYMPGYEVTTAETQYYCQAFEFPDLDQQIINYKVLLDKAEVVHHMILYEAEEADPSEGFFNCDTMPPGASPIYAWAPGNDEFTLPDDVGFDTPKYAILQVHYNNPNGISGLVDRSGVLMEITDEVRKYSAAFLIVGISLNKLEIPPEKENYGVRGVITDLPNAMVGKNVFTSALHMHLIGKRIWTRLWRDGEVLIDSATGLDALGYTDAYDYNYQHFDNRDVIFQKGDQLSTSCVFENTVQRGIDFGNPNAAQGLTVYGGESTQEEMCLSFVGYYPKASSGMMVDPEVMCDDNDDAYMDCSEYS